LFYVYSIQNCLFESFLILTNLSALITLIYRMFYQTFKSKKLYSVITVVFLIVIFTIFKSENIFYDIIAIISSIIKIF